MNELKDIFPKGTIKQWSCLAALFMTAFIGFLMMAGEDDINNPMPFIKWIVIKTIGMALFVSCFKLGQVLEKKGLLPECKED